MLDQSFVYAFQQVSTLDVNSRVPRNTHNNICICSESSHSHSSSLSHRLETLSLFKRVLGLPLVCGLLCGARLAHGVLQQYLTDHAWLRRMNLSLAASLHDVVVACSAPDMSDQLHM